MDPDRETEVLANVALGLDLPTAMVAATDDETPPRRSGCLMAVLVIGGVLWAIAQF
ncbi:MAG: hypothetical protein JW818_02090 [Pirellulales bacterium]|nr:hypothetical protein [Pirellulales bacterium]